MKGGGGLNKNGKGSFWILILKYRTGKIYHTVIKSMDVGIGCVAHSVVGVPPLVSILGWWGVYKFDK